MLSQKQESRRVVVIGSGFGGLAATLELAKAGLEPLLCERLSYPGGCASTFERGGHRFETGATLFSGFGPGQLFRSWIEDGTLEVDYELMDPVIHFRSPGLAVDLGADRASLVTALRGLTKNAHERAGLERFLQEQGRAADLLWTLIDTPAALFPLAPGGLKKHLALLPAYLRFLPLLGQSLRQRLRRYGLHDQRALQLLLDAIGQITLQGSSAEIEALLAMATLDYPCRGAAHIKGGVGELAQAMVRAIEAQGGEVRFLSEVRALEPGADGWQVALKSGSLKAQNVVANLVPQALQQLCPKQQFRDLEWRAQALEQAWSACMQYLIVAEPQAAPSAAQHWQLVLDPERPLTRGNHVFVSISAAKDQMAPVGYRSLTMSTHLRLTGAREQSEAEAAQEVEAVQQAMMQTFRTLMPDWAAGQQLSHSASPRTFRRFLARPRGMVGGLPRLAGLQSYRGLKPCRPASGLWLVGDSVFPGQSTLATAIGGLKAARDLLRRSR